MRFAVQGIVSFLIVILNQGVLAQISSMKFGDVTVNELAISSYEKDLNAEAIVLFSNAKSFFVPTDRIFDNYFEEETRIKIFSEAGLKYAEIEIPFYNEGEDYENVNYIEAYTYNLENGNIQKTQLDLKTVYTEKINKYWNLKKFVLPNVRAGSVIEYKYTIVSPFFQIHDWEFQREIPVLYSKYKVHMVPFYEFVYSLQGASTFTEHQVYKDATVNQYGPTPYSDLVNEFVMKDIAAFNSEDYITSYNDYVIKLSFQLSKVNYLDGTSKRIISTWPMLIKELEAEKKFGKYISRSSKENSAIRKINDLKCNNKFEIVDNIVSYVKNNFSWNGMKGIYAEKQFDEFLISKIGNSANINLFLIGLLKSANIEAYPLLISTRDNGRIKTHHPFIQSFNYVLAAVRINDSLLFADATDLYVRNNQIPIQCLNGIGFILDKDNKKWIEMNANYTSSVKYGFHISSPNIDTLYSKVEVNITDIDAEIYRKNYDNTEKIRLRFDDKEFQVMESTIKTNNYNEISKPYIIDFLTYSKLGIVNGKLYISPFNNLPISENLLTQKERTYPIDLIYPQSRVFNSIIEVPSNFQVLSVPENFYLNDDLFELDYKTETTDNSLKIFAKYTFKKAVYEPENYYRVKSFFDTLIDIMNRKTVLSSKPSTNI